jgi:hypothetical protein
MIMNHDGEGVDASFEVKDLDKHLFEKQKSTQSKHRGKRLQSLDGGGL